MARRGKTVLKSGPDSDKMMRAQEQGAAAEHRASEAVRDQSNRTADASVQLGQLLANTVQNQQQMDAVQGRHEDQMALSRDRLDLQAAQSGYQRNPQQQQPQPGNEREQALQAQMEQGEQETAGLQQSQDPEGDRRQQEQMSRPLGDSPWVPTQERQQQTQFGQQNELQKRDIERANSVARLRTAQANFNKAKISQDKEAQAKERDNLQRPLRLTTGALDKVMNGEELGGKELNYLLQETAGHPVHDMIKNARNLPDKGPIIEHLRNAIDKHTMDFMESTGQTPDSEYVDWSSPKMQALSQNIGYVNQMAKATGMGAYQGIRSKADKVALVNKIAANFTKRGLSQPPPALGAEPPPGPPDPGTVMRTATDEQGNPVGDPVQQRGLTPDEQSRAAETGTRPESEPQPAYRPVSGRARTSPGTRKGKHPRLRARS